MNNRFLDVKIFWSPAIRKESFKGRVEAVSSKNRLGDFDVLPGHANFISLIFETLILHLSNEEITYQFERGVLEISKDEVKVFLGL